MMAKTSNGKVYGASDVLDVLLLALDNAKVGPEQPILRKFEDCEHYETQLTFATRKGQAARHHMDNVGKLIADAAAAAEDGIALVTSSLPSKAGFGVKTSVIRSYPEYIHELSAFMAALRSGLDFLAKIAGRSLKGVTVHSIHTLEGMVAKNLDAPVLAVVRKHAQWLHDLRDYRDEIVHRLVVQAPSAGWTVTHKGKTASAILPIVVPRKTPIRLIA